MGMGILSLFVSCIFPYRPNFSSCIFKLKLDVSAKISKHCISPEIAILMMLFEISMIINVFIGHLLNDYLTLINLRNL